MCKTTWKQIFIELTYVNMNMKKTWQGYGVRLCLRLVLNIMKKMRGPTSIYTPLGDLAQGSFQESLCVDQLIISFKNLFN